MKNIVAALGGGAAADKLWTDGLYVAGERYVVFKVEGRSIYGRKVSFPNSPICSLLGARQALLPWANSDVLQGKEGVVIAKTTQAIIVSHYGENGVAGNAAQTVENLADYLVGLGY